MNLTFTLLGLVDVAAAALIFFPFSEPILLYVMVYMLAKGGFFLTTGIASKSMGPHCILLCISDILVGVALGAVALGYGTIATPGMVGTFIKSVGWIGAIKGIYTTAFPIFS